ncbi:hypothetical protein NK6_9274 [Bradyrhizobium diazoefficiens]|uniref:Uncharacterized protein n=1 Tax=Bradyrhizobium diazoefficiens TaxID=1355477 RepID=A0A0E4BXG2_9BRAD|nr:hypothetical protein NK6_9274 [Bradyrhizobium diazoefficiens]
MLAKLSCGQLEFQLSKLLNQQFNDLLMVGGRQRSDAA